MFRRGPIEFTSLITRIADTMDLLDGAHPFEFITTDRSIITEEYFIHGHMLKRGPRGGLKMIYHGHTAEVPLPNEKHQLYRVRQLTFDLDPEARRRSFVGTNRVTRGMSRATQFEQGGTSRAVGDDEEDGEEATSSSMDISGSRGMPPPRPPCACGA